jgi:hypothetical protein
MHSWLAMVVMHCISITPHSQSYEGGVANGVLPSHSGRQNQGASAQGPVGLLYL